MAIPDFASRTPICKGWSADRKYRAVTADGTQYLLRISGTERYEACKTLFPLLEKLAERGVPMSRPLEYGLCEEGVYALYTWIDGEDGEDAIPLLAGPEQYRLGKRSGEILREIHSIPAPSTQEAWDTRFNRKTDGKIEKYLACPLHFPGDSAMIGYIEDNRGLLQGRPQCFQHGDYHIGNMMMEHGELVIIDFDRFDFGDPWEEFNRIVWCAQKCPRFAAGQLDGYFGGTPPLEFFWLLAFYIASNTLSSIYWAIPFGQGEVDTMMKQSQDVLSWYRNMQDPVPSWYRACAAETAPDAAPFGRGVR